MAEALVDSQLEMLDAAPDAPAVENGDAAPSGPAKPKNLYFVRVPRPQIDEAPVKELQTKLAATLTKLKEYNAKLAAKRVRGVRRGPDRCGIKGAAGRLSGLEGWRSRARRRVSARSRERSQRGRLTPPTRRRPLQMLQLRRPIARRGAWPASRNEALHLPPAACAQLAVHALPAASRFRAHRRLGRACASRWGWRESSSRRRPPNGRTS